MNKTNNEFDKKIEKFVEYDKQKNNNDKMNTFYREELMPDLIKYFIETNKDKVTKEVDYAIYSVGTTYQPIVLSLSLLKPKKVLFLYTEGTKEQLDDILYFVKLKASQYEKEIVNQTNPNKLYSIIKDYYHKWGSKHNIYIDFTGGTKSMAAATAMAGSAINAQLVYVATKEYMKNLRVPKPKTEYLQLIDDPYTIFGELDIAKAKELMLQHDYYHAREIYEKLKETIPDRNKKYIYYINYLLSKMYENWDALQLEDAYHCSKELKEQLNQMIKIDNNVFDEKDTIILTKQFEFLEQIQDINIKSKQILLLLKDSNIFYSFVFALYQNSIRRKEQQKLDMGALLIYRIIEMIMQYRLAKYNLDVSNPHYEKAFNKKQIEDIKRQLPQLRKSIYGNTTREKDWKVSRISLMEGYLLLGALKDEFFKGMNINGKLKEINMCTEIRNNSVFAHGFQFINIKDYEKLEKLMIELLMQLCKIDNIDYNQYLETTKFINSSR